MAERSQVFFITGCSSGIGRATAIAAAEAGHRVFATARRPESIADLGRGIETLALDVTDSRAIHRAVSDAIARAGRIDVLVNNAGFGQMGTVEDIAVARWRAEFDVNVFGTIEVTQAVLPHMRARRSGRVVNIGSIAGRIAYPFGAAYCASKYALEAISDALRLEVERFGIRVVLVEPGPIRTRFGERVEHEVEPIAADTESPYHSWYVKAFERFRRETRIGSLPPEAVARVVLKAAGRRRPRARYLVTWPAKLFAFAKRIVPDAVMDAGMRSKFR
ncbi:MAG TPA: SDR family oxidoreductase [Thermoanaerobaculia bacterium]|jgi:NAD(P)-dependent dehydrogenase (short-subunit alcohol dehydrogenase family)|nr:SDR family oxidoreductase [Thermoanaerobaculia bacterium]